MIRLGAMHDCLALYQDLHSLFLAQGDYARAEEMAALRERASGRFGYMHTCRKDVGAEDGGVVLELSGLQQRLGSLEFRPDHGGQ